VQERIWQEEKEREERIRREEERKKKEEKRKKVRKKVNIGLAVFIVAVVTFFCGYALYVSYENATAFNRQYKAAIETMESGNYDEASNMFQVLGEYKDSADKIIECDYLKAVSYFSEGQYYNAYNLFETIDTYADASEYMVKCAYEAQLRQANLYPSWKNDEKIFTIEKEQMSSEQMLKLAQIYYNAGEYQKSLEFYIYTDDFATNESCLTALDYCYDVAMEYYERGDYVTVEGTLALLMLYDYADSEEKYIECEQSRLQGEQQEIDKLKSSTLLRFEGAWKRNGADGAVVKLSNGTIYYYRKLSEYTNGDFYWSAEYDVDDSGNLTFTYEDYGTYRASGDGKYIVFRNINGNGDGFDILGSLAFYKY
jgi:tetratricopeptide (TPR) repeat protein